jgi:predicted dehydrogenase
MSVRSTPSATSGKIRVGLVGAGNWANHGHLRVLTLLPEFEVVAVQARRRDAAEAAAQRFGIPHVVDSVAEMVDRSDVDMVAVLNTAPQHADTVRAAIAAGKHVYCEWPLTVSTALARELAQRARDAGVRHVVGLQRRLAPHNRYVGDLIREGFVGRLRSVRLHVSMNYFQARRSRALAWTAPPQNFSSVIAIYAGHFLDMLFAAVGWPDSLSAVMINQFPNVTIAETDEVIATTNPDQLVLAGTLGGGAVLSVHIEGGKRNGSGVQIDITGDSGDLRIVNSSAFGNVGDDYVILGAHGDNLPLEPLKVPASYDWLPPSVLPSAVLELANLYAAFARDGRNGTLLAPSFDDAVRLHSFFDQLETSSRDGRRVSLG